MVGEELDKVQSSSVDERERRSTQSWTAEAARRSLLNSGPEKVERIERTLPISPRVDFIMDTRSGDGEKPAADTSALPAWRAMTRRKKGRTLDLIVGRVCVRACVCICEERRKFHDVVLKYRSWLKVWKKAT